MKQRKRSISLLIFIIMTISFAIVLLVVHSSLNSYVRSSAEGTIQSAGHHGNDDSTLFQLMYILPDGETGSNEVQKGDDLNNDDGHKKADGRKDLRGKKYFVDEEYILEWCDQHREQITETTKAVIHGQTYYICRSSEALMDQTGREVILCVNVTPAIWMIRMTEILLLIVMIICICLATWIGHRAGRAIEREQDRQKRFFENASHELKTPLMSIKGFSEGLQKGILPDPEHAYEVINGEAGRMATLVDDILELSKADRGADELKPERVSISEIVGDCLDSLEAEIHRRRLKVYLDIDDVFIEADVEKMKRAVTNLLSNAVRYAESGIWIAFFGNSLSIEDDGRQLSDAELEHIFDRFYTGEGGNTGIGMALAKEIAERHRAGISAENTERGVRFRITFAERTEGSPARNNSKT